MKKLLTAVLLGGTVLLTGCSLVSSAPPADILAETSSPIATSAPEPTPVPTQEPTLSVSGISLSSEDTSILLDHFDEATAMELQSALSALPEIRTVDLTASEPDNDLVIPLLTDFPEVEFLWNPTLCGTHYSSNSTEIDLSGQPIASCDQIRDALLCFPLLEKLILSDCGLSNEELDTLNRDFPDTKIVWTVYFCGNRRSLRTDATAYSTKNSAKKGQTSYEAKRRLHDADASVLAYCTDLVALDLGHNEISDIQFLSRMTQLQILILADNRIADISPMANLKNLIYTELFMNNITDLSPLSHLPKLVDLNLCHNKIEDATPLFGCTTLERLWISSNRIPKKSRSAIEDALPDTNIIFELFDSTGAGWRTHERYDWMHCYFYPEQYESPPDPQAAPPGLRNPLPD